MRTPVMTRRELQREAGLDDKELARLEKCLWIAPETRARRAYGLRDCLRLLRLAKTLRRRKG